MRKAVVVAATTVLVALTAATPRPHWRRDGIGLARFAISVADGDDFVVASLRGVVARIAAKTGETGTPCIKMLLKQVSQCRSQEACRRETNSRSLCVVLAVWRAVPLLRTVSVDEVRVYEGMELVLVFSRASNDADATGSPGTEIRALHLGNGSSLWEVSGCDFTGYMYGNGQSIATLHEGICPHDADGTEEPTSRWLDTASGKFFAGDNIQEPLSAAKYVSARAKTLSNMSETFADGSGAVELVCDHSKGKMLGRRRASGEQLWVRYEGLADVSAAAFYATSNISEPNVGDTIVILSKPGPVFGLDVENSGAVRWIYSALVADEHAESVEAHPSCVLLRGHESIAAFACSYHHPDHSPATKVVFLDANSGELVASQVFDNFTVAQATIDKDCCSNKGAACVRLLDHTGAERFMSNCPQDISRVQERRIPSWIYATLGSPVVSGMRGGSVTWEVRMPEGSLVSAMALSSELHPSSSRMRSLAVRVTGDRRLLYKHMNSAVTLVLASNVVQNEVSAILLDARTGNLLDIVTHPNAAAPVSAVRGENWFVYSFWNTAVLEQELHIIDMYENERDTPWVRNAVRRYAKRSLARMFLHMAPVGAVPPGFLAVGDGGPSDEDTCNAKSTGAMQCQAPVPASHAEPRVDPTFIRASVLLSRRITALDVTETELGITEQAVVMTLASGQVAIVSKMRLNARRPKYPSGYEANEMLLPYRPAIYLSSKSSDNSYVTLDQFVTSVNGIAIAPAQKQESSCHVLVFGVDLFYRKVAAAGSYDSLPEDFNYLAVFGTLVLLAFGALYAKRMSQESSLRAAW